MNILLVYQRISSVLVMSEILFLLGCVDPRVRPFVSCVRWWARQKDLTRKRSPGRWFSSFTITLMALFFLMNTQEGPVLPTLKHLLELPKTGKVRLIEVITTLVYAYFYWTHNSHKLSQSTLFLYYLHKSPCMYVYF